ncbi:MAG TPA: hypothetical protein PLE54_06075 [Burkholderiaceae bacterium]|nr:hypothetical protein [Burkholderiaceae bacterium]
MTWELRGIRSRFRGSVTAADLLHHVREVCRHPQFSDLRYSILDFRDATDAVDDGALLEVRAELIRSQYRNPQILVAAITKERAVIDHLTRFIGLGVLNRQIQVFPTPDAAMDWITEQSTFLLH